MAFRTLIHDFFLFQLSLFIQFLDGTGGLREKVMATVAVAEGLLMTVMGKRNVPEIAAQQNHFLCSFLNFGSAERNARYQDNKQRKEDHFFYGRLHKFKCLSLSNGPNPQFQSRKNGSSGLMSVSLAVRRRQSKGFDRLVKKHGIQPCKGPYLNGRQEFRICLYSARYRHGTEHTLKGLKNRFNILWRAGVCLAGLTFQCTLAKVNIFSAFAADMFTVEFIRKYFFFCTTLRAPAPKGL